VPAPLPKVLSFQCRFPEITNVVLLSVILNAVFAIVANDAANDDDDGIAKVCVFPVVFTVTVTGPTFAMRLVLDCLVGLLFGGRRRPAL